MTAPLIVSASLSLDGVIQSPFRPDEDTAGGFDRGGWMLPYADAALDTAMAESFAGAGSMLLGRRSYDILSAFWPENPDEDGAEQLNAMRKYVATRTAFEAAWQNTEVLAGDAATTVAALKDRERQPVLVQGSSDLLRTLEAAGLVDEYHLFVVPVVLGGGKPLFHDGAKPGGLRLLRSTTTGSGVICAAYAVS
jgi:dihydrofolate reductase